MTDFLLVHGAWHGGWCWDVVAELLGERGHRVFTPTLSGLGDRAALLAPDNNLSLHVQDVLNVVETQGLSSFVLCGHSYGGMVVRKVADEIGEAVKTLVYLDAYVLAHGECGMDLRSSEANLRLLKTVEEGWRMPSPPAALFGVEREEDRVRVDSLLTPMALGCFQEKVHLSGSLAPDLPVHYLRTAWPNESLDHFYREAWEAGRRVERWNCGHDMMIDRPQETADFLDRIL